MSEVIDNRARRVQTLKQIIRHLHAGKPADEVRDELKKMVGETDYSEIAAMEAQLMAEGMPVEEVQCMCDLHSQVTRDILVQIPARPVAPGHPVDTLRRENEALRGVLLKMRMAMGEVRLLPDDASAVNGLLRWRQASNELMDVEKHYQRKEHCLFSRLELHGITGPSKVMWGKHDEIRGLLKSLDEALRGPDVPAAHWKAVAAGIGEKTAAAVEEMIHKEENILLPLCMDTFTEEDWAEIWSASPRYGWCLVEPQDGYRPAPSVLKEAVPLNSTDAVHLPTGNVTLAQLTAILKTLPVDLTFVDAEDRVGFYSEGPDRVFARSRAIIGRKVQHCHPPRSVGVVDRILSDFREGRQSVAEFWINFQGRFVHIRYFAVRGEDGEYLGTLEVTQDATSLRTLEGERRLLAYDEKPDGEVRVVAPAEAPGRPEQDAGPDWVDESRVVMVLDGGAMLKTGEHPVGKVRAAAAALKPGEILKLLTPFRPAPLLEMMAGMGLRVASVEDKPGEHISYFGRA